MFVKDEVRQCVVFIGYRLPSGELSLQGTAFFVFRSVHDNYEQSTQGFTHLVTAAHVIQGISSKNDFDGKILIKASRMDGTVAIFEERIELWQFHPTESEVDVAVLPFVSPLQEQTDSKVIPLGMFLSDDVRDEHEIGLGDEVFLPGLFINHHGRQRNIPIVRAGNIAAMPEEKVYTSFGIIDAYLVEARSIGGLSGSPVFVHLGMDRKFEKNSFLVGTGERTGTNFLLGLMHGHYKVQPAPSQPSPDATLQEEAINMGIAIVVPSEKILEVLGQPAIRDLENQLEEEAAAGGRNT